MDEIMSIYNGSIISISILIFLLGGVAIKSARSGYARLFILVFALLAYGALFTGPLQLLSYAKPTSMEWVNRNVEEAEVLHAELREGDGIYLLLDWYGTPRYYKLNWDPDLAQQLIEAMEEARKEAGDGDRAGSLPPSVREGPNADSQGALDQMLGPQAQSEEGESQVGTMSAQRQAPQGSEMTNAGNGKVMMRRPFKDGEVVEGSPTDQGNEAEGEGPSADYDDTDSEAMFYAKPQPRYPDKVAPTGPLRAQ